MMRPNEDVREAVKKAGLYLWQIAVRLGMNDGNFSRLLRRELSAETKARVYGVIAELSASKGAKSNVL